MAAVRIIRGNHNRRRSRAAEEEALGESGQHGSQAFGHQIPRTETANFFYASHSSAPSHGRPRTMRGLPEAEVKGEPFRVGGTTLPGWSESSSRGAQGTPSQGTPSREARHGYLCASPGGYPGGAQTLPPLMIQGEGGGSSSFHHHHDRGDSQRLLLSAALLGGPLSGVRPGVERRAQSPTIRSKARARTASVFLICDTRAFRLKNSSTHFSLMAWNNEQHTAGVLG